MVLVITGAAAATAFAVVAGPALTHAVRRARIRRPCRRGCSSLGQALNFFSQLCAMTLIATGRHRIYPYASLAGVVANIVLNLLLIPHFSATGFGHRDGDHRGHRHRRDGGRSSCRSPECGRSRGGRSRSWPSAPLAMAGDDRAPSKAR